MCSSLFPVRVAQDCICHDGSALPLQRRDHSVLLQVHSTSGTQPEEDKESWRHTNPNRQWGQHLQVIFLAFRQYFWHDEFLEKQIILRMEKVNQLLKNCRGKEGIY